MYCSNSVSVFYLFFFVTYHAVKWGPCMILTPVSSPSAIKGELPLQRWRQFRESLKRHLLNLMTHPFHSFSQNSALTSRLCVERSRWPCSFIMGLWQFSEIKKSHRTILVIFPLPIFSSLPLTCECRFLVRNSVRFLVWLKLFWVKFTWFIVGILMKF